MRKEKEPLRERLNQKGGGNMYLNDKDLKVTITISVDKTELDEAIQKMKELHELQEKVNRPSVTREPIHN